MNFQWMVRFLRYYLDSSMFLLGDVVIKQRRGVPMGGGASKIASPLLLAHYETQWLLSSELRLQHRFEHGVRSFREQTDGKRYVDDLLVMSTAYCQQCLFEMLRIMYPFPLVVNLEGRGPHVEWLDLVLHVTSALQIQQKPLLVPGQPTHLQKHSLAQYQVDKGSARRLSWWIASRCHKATHIYKQLNNSQRRTLMRCIMHFSMGTH